MDERAAIRLLVCGNSVPLNVQPRRAGTYPEQLRRALAPTGGEVANRARDHAMVDEDDALLLGHLRETSPTDVVLHYGINEAVPRILPRPLWMWLKAPQKYPRWKWALYRVEHGAERHLIRWLRPPGWIGASEFERGLRRKVELVRAAGARAILVNLGPPSAWFERALPGVGTRAATYNAAIARVAATTGAALVDAYRLVVEHGIDVQPDGVHFTGEGHRLLAREVWACLARAHPGLPPLPEPAPGKVRVAG